MKTKQITSTNANDEQQLKLLYESAFPKNEQIPWNDLVSLIDKMSLDFTAYYEENNLVGFTVVFPLKQFNWYWYFAVKPELRGQGKGQKILTSLTEKYKDKNCVLDMESPEQKCSNIEQRKQRHAFYLRNGFRDTNLYKKYNDIEMTIMVMGDADFTMKDWDNITAELRKFWTWD